MTSTSAAHRTMSSSLHLSPSTLKASMTTQTRVERNFRKAKNMVNRELVAFMTETTSAMSRLEDALPDEQLWHVDHAMGVAQRCIQEPLERFKESVKDEVDQLEELRRKLDADSVFCKQMYAKLLFVLSHCSRLMATRDENSPGVAGTPACFKAARTKRERRSSVKGKRDGDWGAGRSGSGGKSGASLRVGVSCQGRSGSSSSLKQQHASVSAADGRIGRQGAGSGVPVTGVSPGSSPRGSSRSWSPGRVPGYLPVIRQLQELHVVGVGDANSHRDLGIPELPVPVVRTTVANAHHQQTPSTPPSGGLPRYVLGWAGVAWNSVSAGRASKICGGDALLFAPRPWLLTDSMSRSVQYFQGNAVAAWASRFKSGGASGSSESLRSRFRGRGFGDAVRGNWNVTRRRGGEHGDASGNFPTGITWAYPIKLQRIAAARDPAANAAEQSEEERVTGVPVVGECLSAGQPAKQQLYRCHHIKPKCQPGARLQDAEDPG